MRLSPLVQWAIEKPRFATLGDYIDFARAFSGYLADDIQATILCQNEVSYRFFQFDDEGHRNVTRPINSAIWIAPGALDETLKLFEDALNALKEGAQPSESERAALVPAIYTLQQSIGAALDALPSGASNQARKVNGDLFERLIGLVIQRMGVPCTSGTVRVAIKDDAGHRLFDMSYQRDIVVERDGRVVLIGSVKTSSKDRGDKVFMDKFLFNRLTEADTPHVAVFLNDVQRAGARTQGRYRIASTFLTNRFKGYSLKLNPLDGVYYCDLRPNMLSDAYLASQIKKLDHFLCADIFNFVQRARGVEAEIDQTEASDAEEE